MCDMILYPTYYDMLYMLYERVENRAGVLNFTEDLDDDGIAEMYALYDRADAIRSMAMKASRFNA